MRDYHWRAIKYLICKVLPHKWKTAKQDRIDPETRDHLRVAWDVCERCGERSEERILRRVKQKVAQEEQTRYSW